MVKTLTSIFLSLTLLIGISVYEIYYVEKEFTEFSEQLESLYSKTEEHTASVEDAEAVRISWNDKKKTLHIWIPHNDISYVDYWLSEALGCIYTESYDDALSKIEVLQEIAKNIPSSYAFSLENIL
jgi:hypothetical protein